MVKQQKKSKQPMKVRNIEDLGINTQTGDMLSRALKIYNSPATSYKLPFTLGKPQNNPTVMAMDACINHIIDMCAPEWQALAVPRFLGYPMLSNIAQDPLIRSGIEVIVDDMTRKFIDLTSKGENDLSTSIAELESDLQSFRIKSIFNRALATTGYQGGCLVYIDVGELDDEEKKTPLYLDAATFKKGSFRGLRIIEPINLYPGRYDTLDPTSEDYFNPETWFVLGKEYHRSRFLYFAQNEVPLILKPLYNFFGISLAQQVLEYVQNFTENRRSAQRLLNKFSLTIWRTDMSQFLSGGDCNSLTQRVKYFNAQRSNDGTVLLDKETEEMEQINTPLSGVTDIVSMSLDLAPVILGISKDKYFGDLPKGLNASSEGTNRIYYDKIQSLNEKICYDNVEKVLKILQLNRYGEIDDNISFQFAPLWEMDERERAEINKVKADTVAVYLDRGALSAEEVRGALADNPDSGFSNIDVDDVPESESFSDIDDVDKAGAVYDEAMDGWITVYPSGKEDEDNYRRLFVKPGETNRQAVERKFKKDASAHNAGNVGTGKINALSSKASFVPAKTTQEAEKFAKSLGIKADYSKFKIEEANAANEAVWRIKEEFGDITNDLTALKSIGRLTGGSRASALGLYSPSNESIVVRRQTPEYAAKAFAKGWTSSDSIYHTIHHELGHAIHYSIKRNGEWSLLNKMDVFINKNPIERGFLSNYGEASGNGEWIAEAFADYLGGHPKQVTIDFINMIKDEMKGNKYV